MSKIICDIFKSPKKEGYYLYVEKSKGPGAAPEALLEIFGKPQHLMTLLLTAEKKLAHAKAEDVMQQLNDKGFYLQITQEEDEYMKEINKHNDKLFGHS